MELEVKLSLFSVGQIAVGDAADKGHYQKAGKVFSDGDALF